MKAGRRCATFPHVSNPSSMFFTAWTTASSEPRSWAVLSRSRRVTEPLGNVSKSIVMPIGVPNSSLRAFRLPMEALEESTLLEMPRSRSRADRGGGEGHRALVVFQKLLEVEELALCSLGPTVDLNIRLKGTGGRTCPLPLGLRMFNHLIIAPNSSPS